MDFGLSPRGRDYLERTRAFMAEQFEPVEGAFWEEARAHTANGDWTKWKVPAVLAELKARAHAQNLSNMWIPDATLGQGLSIADYAHIAEQTGCSLLAPTVFNCNAPDTGIGKR